MSRKHSTLLKEEVDDDENGSGSDGVKKREKDKDGEYKKKKTFKKGDKTEGYFNDSMSKTARAMGGAAVNPSAEAITSPVHTQQPIPPSLQPPPSTRNQHATAISTNMQSYSSSTVTNMQSYSGSVPSQSVNSSASNWQQQQQAMRLPPPPGAQHQQYQVQPNASLPQAQFAPQNISPTQRQVYQTQAQPPPGQVYQTSSHQQSQVYQGQLPQQGQNYQQQHGQVYQPPTPQAQNYQPPPSQQGQNYQAPPPQNQGQIYQHPSQQPQQNQNYQGPSPQQGQNYQAPPSQQGQNYQAPPPQQAQVYKHQTQQSQSFKSSHPQQGQNYQAPPPQQGQNYQAPPPQQGFYAVGVVGFPGGTMLHHGQAAQGPQSPSGQTHEPNWNQYTDGNWTGHPHDGSWTPHQLPPDQQRDGNWAAFNRRQQVKTPPKRKQKEITWQESPDNSSSGEEIESNDDDDDEEQQELIRPPSPSKSTSSIEEDHETSPWLIQSDQYDYYTKQFKRLQPNEGGVIKGPKARDFFLKSNLSTEILSKVWHLSDINQDNALDLDEFCIAMHLVVAIRHGLDLPLTLPYELLHHRQVYNDSQSGHDSEDSRETTEEDGKHLNIARRNRSQSDTSLNEDHHPETVSRKTSMPVTSKIDEEGRTLSPDPNVKIPRPKATNISLIDSRPGQLLPPPQPGKFPTWTPSKADQDSDSAESDDDDSESSSSSSDNDDDDEEPRPLSPGPSTPPMPPLEEDGPIEEYKEETGEREEEEEGIPTPPSTPKGEAPKPVFPDIAQVTRRLSRKSIERPRSAGDVNDIIPSPTSDGSSASTPTNSSIGSDGKKDPPPPPPRRKEKGHSRSSSLDLNKLFGPKSKEARASTFGSLTSSQSSHTSQSSETALPLKSEPKTEQENTDQQEENQENAEEPAKEENFADFSNFETLVKAQGTSSESQMSVPSQGRMHRRSLSLDQAQDYWPKTSNNIDSTADGPAKPQEALPRPVPKLKHPVSPPVKLLTLNKQTPRKDGNDERKLKTEPPKVVVKPLTKETKLQNSIRELKETNLLLSRLNSELQQENKELMEQRISLEVKIERLKPFKSN